MQRVFDLSKFDIIGNPIISEDGWAKLSSDTDRILAKNNPLANITKDDIVEVYTRFKTGNISELTGLTEGLLHIGTSDRLGSDILIRYTSKDLQVNGSATDNIGSNAVAITPSDNTEYIVKYKLVFAGSTKQKNTTNGFIEAEIFDTNNNLIKRGVAYAASNFKIMHNYNNGFISFGSLNTSEYLSPMLYSEINLRDTKIFLNGKEVFSGSTLVPSEYQGTITDKLIYLNDTKQIIKSAIEAKGVEVSTETPFRQYANKISEISSGGYQPYTKTPNLIYNSSQISNGNILYNGIWAKRYRTFNNANTDLMYANVPFNFNNKFEFLYHINSDSLAYTSRIAGYSQSSSAQLLQTGINSSRQIYLDIKEKDSDSNFKSLVPGYTYNVNTDYFIKIVYDGSSKIELFVSVDNKVFQKIGELAITINYSVLCQVYFACSKNYSSSRDLNGTIDFNYVHFLYPDDPENNWYAMS